jgi:hypothetical protein
LKAKTRLETLVPSFLATESERSRRIEAGLVEMTLFGVLE